MTPAPPTTIIPRPTIGRDDPATIEARIREVREAAERQYRETGRRRAKRRTRREEGAK